MLTQSWQCRECAHLVFGSFSLPSAQSIRSKHEYWLMHCHHKHFHSSGKQPFAFKTVNVVAAVRSSHNHRVWARSSSLLHIQQHFNFCFQNILIEDSLLDNMGIGIWKVFLHYISKVIMHIMNFYKYSHHSAIIYQLQNKVMCTWLT